MPAPEAEPAVWLQSVSVASKCCKHLFISVLTSSRFNNIEHQDIKAPNTVLAADVSTHSCTLCTRVFSTETQLNSHRSRVHGIKLVGRCYAHDCNTCLCCLRRYGSRDQLLQHFRTSYTCLDAVKSKLTPLADEAVAALDRQALELQRTRATLKHPNPRVRQLLGPRFTIDAT